MSYKEQLEDFKSVLNQFSEKYIRPKDISIDDILEADEATRLGWAEQELQAKAGSVRRYCYWIQLEINKQVATKKWAEHNMKVIEGKECSKYGNQYTKYEERLGMLLADNEAYRVLSEIQLNADTRISMLFGVIDKIGQYAESLIEMAKSKRACHYEK